MISKARSKQCSDFERTRGKSELSTVNSDFEDSAELNTGLCDTEGSFEAMQGLRQNLGKAELSAVDRGLEG